MLNYLKLFFFLLEWTSLLSNTERYLGKFKYKDVKKKKSNERVKEAIITIISGLRLVDKRSLTEKTKKEGKWKEKKKAWH